MSGVLLDLWVPGYARPKGSMRAMLTFGARAGDSTSRPQPCPHCHRPVRVYLEQSVKDSVRWAHQVTVAVRDDLPAPPPRHPGPVNIQCRFYFDRPDGEADPWPTKQRYGDDDKLERNVWDALTKAGLWDDDRQVVGNWASKQWAPAGYTAGAQITVWRADDH